MCYMCICGTCICVCVNNKFTNNTLYILVFHVLYVYRGLCFAHGLTYLDTYFIGKIWNTSRFRMILGIRHGLRPKSMDV